MLYRIRNGLVTIPAAAYLEPVPICARRFETRYVQVQCNTGTYNQTFFPSASRLWNSLPVDILPGISRQFQDPSQQFLFHLSHCTVFIRSYCSLSAARLSRYTSAYSLVVTHCSESSRHHYRKMKMDLCLMVVGMVIVGMVTVRIVTHTPVRPTCTYSYASEISILNHSCTSCC